MAKTQYTLPYDPHPQKTKRNMPTIIQYHCIMDGKNATALCLNLNSEARTTVYFRKWTIGCGFHATPHRKFLRYFIRIKNFFNAL